MRKIPTLLLRDPEDRRFVIPVVQQGCEWVLAGEGRALRKYDGTCVLHADEDGQGSWWARREVKPGKTPPPGWWEADRDDVTGKRMGWEPIGASPFARYFDEAIREGLGPWLPGTYELVGPRINGNPEGRRRHQLVLHAAAEIDATPTPSVTAIRELVALNADALGWEGLVWHHPDGRMAKLKARDLPEAQKRAAT